MKVARAKQALLGAPGLDPPEDVRWRIPAEVEILGNRWAVEFHPEWHPLIAGDCDVVGRRIRICDGLEPSMVREVFFHELLHAMLGAAGIVSEEDRDAEERFVTRLTPIMVDTLRRNKFRFG